MKPNPKAKIIPATAELCGRLIAHISAEDNEDMLRGWGITSAEAVMSSYILCQPSYMVLCEDEPMFIFGCDNNGSVWMMRGDNMESISIQFIRGSQRFFDFWLKKYGHISCEFWGENKKLRRFLEWSGFGATELDNGYVRCEKWAQPQD